MGQVEGKQQDGDNRKGNERGERRQEEVEEIAEEDMDEMLTEQRVRTQMGYASVNSVYMTIHHECDYSTFIDTSMIIKVLDVD